MGRTTSLLLWTGGVAGVVGIGLLNSTNRRIARATFEGWSKGRGSLFDLMDEDATIVIPGIAPHCGTFQKAAFVSEIAGPFMARFSAPPRPRPIKLWAVGKHVVVMAEADGTRRDGKPYRNDYVFVLEFRSGRVVRAIEFLDMTAFNEVWDQVKPAAVAGASR